MGKCEELEQRKIMLYVMHSVFILIFVYLINNYAILILRIIYYLVRKIRTKKRNIISREKLQVVNKNEKITRPNLK